MTVIDFDRLMVLVLLGRTTMKANVHCDP